MKDELLMELYQRVKENMKRRILMRTPKQKSILPYPTKGFYSYGLFLQFLEKNLQGKIP